MSEFSIYHSDAGDKPLTLKVGDYVSAMFTADDVWYRARIQKVNPDKTYGVLYIDYGNAETIPASRIRELDAKFSTRVLSPQAQEFSFAFLDFPSDDTQSVYDFLREETERKDLKMRVMKDGILLYTTQGIKTGMSINEELVKNGFAVVKKSVVKKMESRQISAVELIMRQRQRQGVAARVTIGDTIEALIEAQDYAKKNHVRLFLW